MQWEERPLLPSTPSFRLDGRTALITGAGRGIGMAATVALARAGAHVTLAARSNCEIKTVAAALRELGHEADAVSLDVTDSAKVREFVEDSGPFQILVNNAGMNRPSLLTESLDDDIDAVIELNVKAALFVARVVVRSLVAHSLSGSIIHVSSQMGRVGGAQRTVYCATKHALEGFSKALAWEVGSRGIRVNTVCPTFVSTEMTRSQLEDPEFRNFVLSKIAIGRLAELPDLMGPIVFLASDAAAMVTGASLMVDGGWTAS